MRDLRCLIVVPVDEPLPGLDRLVELAARLEQTGLDPARQQVVGVDLLRASHRGLGGFPVAAGQVQIGQPRREVGVLGRLGLGGLESLDRLVIIPLTGLAIGQAKYYRDFQGGREFCRLLLRVGQESRKGFLGLGISAVLQQPLRLLEFLFRRHGRGRRLLLGLRRGGRPLGDDHRRDHHDTVCHAWNLLGLVLPRYQRTGLIDTSPDQVWRDRAERNWPGRRSGLFREFAGPRRSRAVPCPIARSHAPEFRTWK